MVAVRKVHARRVHASIDEVDERGHIPAGGAHSAENLGLLPAKRASERGSVGVQERVWLRIGSAGAHMVVSAVDGIGIAGKMHDVPTA